MRALKEEVQHHPTNPTIHCVFTSLPFVINHPRKKNETMTTLIQNFTFSIFLGTFANCEPHDDQGEKI